MQKKAAQRSRSRSRDRSPYSRPVAGRSKPMLASQKKKVIKERLQIILDDQEDESETLYGKHLFQKSGLASRWK